MFKHLLLPSDGSPLSEAAVQTAMTFARSINSKVTGIHVMPEFHVLTYRADMLADTKDKFANDSKSYANELLASIQSAAKLAGVACDTAAVTSDEPYAAIIRAADERNCDLIVMASHGRRGVRAILLGSETQKVLTHSNIPVLVLR